MGKTESIYLDLIRFLAALLVFSSHAAVVAGGVMPFSDYGHDAVVIFFVLSGYVIAYTADTKERTLQDYSISRLARLFSVAVPALILTVVCDWIGRNASGFEVYNPYAGNSPFIRILSSASFTNEIWFVSIMPLSNGPFWSLCYEFWFYVMFACATYIPDRSRYAYVLFSAMIAGPKILLLLPIWLSGVVLFRWERGRRLGWKAATLIFIATPVSFGLFRTSGGGAYILLRQRIRYLAMKCSENLSILGILSVIM